MEEVVVLVVGSTIGLHKLGYELIDFSISIKSGTINLNLLSP